ncbi:16S rRNA (uracil(1498)-N(3))-methyltransferase [Petroclostridium sp. X23]|uniref:16S rRNA (uracil(1498)-N(3))-methyltransferase n=1 Tax=Petroclostridium sp. X23 TaxID=3045146 RepID=UPI0024AD0167|nr:16S rRNA (uracil(1498)-N(3))-methyltransferase [Petroclostridium sp. X23]WHH60424.1 16S rRNA (uracil(1498)-N(3))-methyltransferase [Petroclostridium sp. X23]
MPKFFVAPEQIEGDSITIQGEDVNHIIKVLRFKPNDSIVVCDGNGKDYTACIEEMGKKEVKAVIQKVISSQSEPSIDVTLFQGIPKSGKMEYIIQKNTELGINRIVPVMTQRTVVKIEDKKSLSNKMDRWQKVALEAAKQCNRGRIPKICAPISLEEAIIQMSEMDLSFMPYEKEENNRLRNILSAARGAKTIGVLIGPEGGFDAEEVEKAAQAEVSTVSLGPRILRTETAGAAVLSILMYEMEDI